MDLCDSTLITKKIRENKVQANNVNGSFDSDSGSQHNVDGQDRTLSGQFKRTVSGTLFRTEDNCSGLDVQDINAPQQRIRGSSSETSLLAAVVSRGNRETGCWGALQVVIMAVTARTFSEFTCPAKSLEAGIVDAIITVLSVEYFKQMFNYSGGMKKEAEFTFNWKSTLAHTAFFIVYVPAFFYIYARHNKDHFNPVGFDASIIVPGIIVKLLLNYIEVNFTCGVTLAHDPMTEALMDNAPQTQTSQYAGNWWQNKCAAYFGIELFLLACATNAGGQYFEALGIPLLEKIEATGLTNLIAIVIFSVYLNAAVGFVLMGNSGKFIEKMPTEHLASRVFPQFILAISFQFINYTTTSPLGDLGLGFLIGLLTLVIVQESILGRIMNEGATYLRANLQAKCCLWQPEDTTTTDTGTYNPITLRNDSGDDQA